MSNISLSCWNQIASEVASQFHRTPSQNAEMFALLNIGLADAAISCWDAKYHYDLWRPIAATILAGLFVESASFTTRIDGQNAPGQNLPKMSAHGSPDTSSSANLSH
jgi:hypothetical protein